MKTLSKLTGTKDALINFIAGIGLMTVTTLICSFIILAIKNGIKPF